MKNIRQFALLACVLLLASVTFAQSPVQPAQVVTSLNAATATGTGTVYAVKTWYTTSPANMFTWTMKTSGTPTGVSVNLEGSLNNSDWFVLDTSTATTSEMRHVVNKPVLYLRANLTTLSGGTAPTVTVQFMPAAQ